MVNFTMADKKSEIIDKIKALASKDNNKINDFFKENSGQSMDDLMDNMKNELPDLGDLIDQMMDKFKDLEGKADEFQKQLDDQLNKLKERN
ncbi:unnamed protein product [Bursaphelenchus okinawaensis]|uniref:Uncharacterized protein n=1 Tax=Bursaphelenchus okinawaensis TaxID=465554 RepID=A0A811KSX2_9BILA|nr:unnamed protein product [Bursaphelenchus okinawaensis]CAG9111894.1 unnamed protein product [Bursaphelenchus okinawaensis]